jgi:hypothetical protein
MTSGLPISASSMSREPSPTCDVVDDDRDRRISDVRRDKRAETFLQASRLLFRCEKDFGSLGYSITDGWLVSAIKV